MPYDAHLAKTLIYRVYIPGFEVLIRTCVDLVGHHRSLEGTRAAFLYRVEVHSDEMGSVDLIHVDSPKCQMNWKSRPVKVMWPTVDLADGTLLFLAHMLLEEKMSLSGFFSIHGACVVINGQGVVFLGKTGSGKTSLVLATCLEYEATLLGNDVIVLGTRDDQLNCLAGTKALHLRERSVTPAFPALGKYFPRTDDPWSNKVFVMPKEIGLRTTLAPTDVTKVFLVHIDVSGAPLYERSADSLATRLYLHEELSRYIRGTAVTAFSRSKKNSLGYIPSLDSVTRFHRRDIFVERVVRNATYVSGRLDEVSAYVARLAQ